MVTLRILAFSLYQAPIIMFGADNDLKHSRDVDDISISYLGNRSNYVAWYYLMLKLRSGKEYPLFSPGRFFEGGSD